jgi:hypothetical protein
MKTKKSKLYRTKDDSVIIDAKAFYSTKSLDEMYEHTAQELGKNEDELRSELSHLNPGIQKMRLNCEMYNYLGYSW